MPFVEQFIRFTSDASGLERTFRLVQALLVTVTSTPLLLGIAASYMADTADIADNKEEHALAATAVVLTGACARVNLWRRFFRVFRFVESFHAASQLMGTLWAAGSNAPQWLDLFARMFSGMYLFLESLTVVDAMGVAGLAVWGPERARVLNVEGQRYWFLSLGCTVLAAVVRMLRVAKDLPPPVPTAGEKEQQDHLKSPLPADDDDDDSKLQKLEAERLRLRQIVQTRTAQRRAWVRQVQARLVVLGRRAVADFVDMLGPGSIVGWTPVSAQTIGITMAFTTLLTGYDVWLRCGRELAEAAKAAEAAEAAKEANKNGQDTK